MTLTPAEILTARVAEIEKRLDRIEVAVRTTAAWLAQTPGVWGTRDVRGIEDILAPPEEQQ